MNVKKWLQERGNNRKPNQIKHQADQGHLILFFFNSDRDRGKCHWWPTVSDSVCRNEINTKQPGIPAPVCSGILCVTLKYYGFQIITENKTDFNIYAIWRVETSSNVGYTTVVKMIEETMIGWKVRSHINSKLE